MGTRFMITDSQIDEILIDLLRHSPTGPMYPLKFYSDSPETFGYGHQVIFALDLHTKYATEQCLLTKFHGTAQDRGYKPLEGTKAAVHKRRTNRLWNRIEPSIKEMWKTGGEGIYRVAAGKYWGSIKLGHVWAYEKESAQKLADLCFSYILSDLQAINDDASKIYVQYCSAKGPEEIDSLNKSIEEELVRQRDSVIKVVATSDDVLKSIDVRLKAMKIAQESMN